MAGNTVSWDVTNDSTSEVRIDRIELDWPSGNVELDRIRLGGSSIWNGSDGAPPSDISSGWSGNRKLDGGESKPLRFEFTLVLPVPGAYDLQIYLDVGCQLSAGG